MIYIHGIGHFHPNNVIDNKFLENLSIETNNEWIIERVGIRERRTVLSLDYIKETHNKNPVSSTGTHIQFTNAQTGALAAQIALKRANLSPQNITMVIAGSCSPQYSIPAEACTIASELGIEAPAFDINSACSTFAIHMHMMNQMQETSNSDYTLLVIPDNSTRTINYSDRSSAVLWGDCSTAIIVSKKHKSNVRVIDTMISSNPASWGKVVIPTGGHFAQEGPAVQRFAIKQSVSIIKQLRSQHPTLAEQHYFIGHQANLTALNTICNMLNISDKKHLYNVDQFGNCGAAGAPSVLSQNWDKFRAGDSVLIAVVGSGLTWGGMAIEIT